MREREREILIRYLGSIILRLNDSQWPGQAVKVTFRNFGCLHTWNANYENRLLKWKIIVLFLLFFFFHFHACLCQPTFDQIESYTESVLLFFSNLINPATKLAKYIHVFLEEERNFEERFLKKIRRIGFARNMTFRETFNRVENAKGYSSWPTGFERRVNFDRWSFKRQRILIP